MRDLAHRRSARRVLRPVAPPSGPQRPGAHSRRCAVRGRWRVVRASAVARRRCVVADDFENAIVTHERQRLRGVARPRLHSAICDESIPTSIDDLGTAIIPQRGCSRSRRSSSKARRATSRSGRESCDRPAETVAISRHHTAFDPSLSRNPPFSETAIEQDLVALSAVRAGMMMKNDRVTGFCRSKLAKHHWSLVAQDVRYHLVQFANERPSR